MSMLETELAPGLRVRPAGWLATFASDDRAARLDVVTGEDGLAPETCEASGCRIVFDGALYDRADVAALVPGVPEAASDAELVLRGYLALGDGILARLKGEFVVLIHSSRTGRLVCARDRMGVYPLFYAELPGKLVLATSIETLLRHPEVPRELNRALLAEHLLYRWDEKDETCFRAIRRVRARHALVAEPSGRRLVPYWEPVPAEGGVSWAEDDEVDRFGDVLERAVGRCLRHGPGAICLSGGIDSVSVASAAAGLSRREGRPTPWALSVAFPDPVRMDEELAVQRGVASALGLPQVLLTLDEALGGRGLLPSSLELGRTWPVPLLGIFSPAYFRLIEDAKANGCSTILTGAGGDDWLAVSPVYATDLLSRVRFLRLYRFWQSYRRSYRVRSDVLMRRLLWRYGLRPVLASLQARLLGRLSPTFVETRMQRRRNEAIPPWIAPDAGLRRELAERALPPPPPRPGRAYLGEIAQSFDHPLLARELEEAFEKSRRLGAAIRMPYYDVDLVELLYRTPPEVLSEGGRSKSPARKLVAGRFDGLGLERQKKITTGNFWPQKEEEALEAWRDTAGTPALAELGIVDQKRLAAHLHESRAAGHPVFAYRVWDVLNLECWTRQRL